MVSMDQTMNKIQNAEYTNDELYTPSSLSKKLISEIEIEEGHSCFDPFFGTGSFFNNFPPNVKNALTEINLGSDFFKYNHQHDWIISNPPFSQLTKILEHTMKLSKVGFAYIMPAYSLTHSRIKMINQFDFHIEKIVFFKNPKEWLLGFQMLFVIFTKSKNPSFVNLESDSSIQMRLI